jgi:hypothetical protein
VLEEPRSPVDEEVLSRSFEQTGAVVLGRRLFDVVDGPHGWDDGVGYGHDQDQSVAPPCYVVTHEKPAQVRLASRFRFVTGGVAAAIDQARAAAGDKDVVVGTASRSSGRPTSLRRRPGEPWRGRHQDADPVFGHPWPLTRVIVSPQRARPHPPRHSRS